MLKVCEKLGIPVALDKLEGPATTITFLGITIDIALQQLRFPPDKLQEMTLLIKSWLGKHKTTKRDLLSLIGKLSFAAKVVPSGHHFLRRLIELSTPVSKLHHHIHLNVEAREDIIWWNSDYDFCSTHHRKPLPGTARTLALFVTDLIDINLALRLPASPFWLVNMFPLVAVVALTEVRTSKRSTSRSPASTNQGIECSMPAAHLKPKHQLITNEMLGQMLSELDRDHKPSHDRFMLKAAIILGFFGLFRVSEFIVPNRVDLTLTSSLPQRTSCGQHSQRALRLVLHHLIRRCGYSTKLYHTHSLRIGAATAVSRSGLPPATIKNLGRWRSEAYKVYMCHLLTQL
eukprot:Em0040g36a